MHSNFFKCLKRYIGGMRHFPKSFTVFVMPFCN